MSTKLAHSTELAHSSKLAHSIVERIHERIQSQNIVNLAQLPTEYDPTGLRQLERLLDDVVSSLSPELQNRIRDEYLGDGPLKTLLSDPSITEVIVNGSQEISFEREGRLCSWPDHFLSEVTYRNFLVRLSREAGIQVTLEHPFANGTWREFRVHVASPPISKQGPIITLRRLARHFWNWERLQENDFCSQEARELLQAFTFERKNVLIVGATGTGKTSVLNAYLQSIPNTERVITIEDVPELIVPNALSSQLITRFDPQGVLREIDLGELVTQSLRMRPDRLVLGEVRGNEAKNLLMAWSTGHAGSWATLHADSARQALLRLEMLIQLGAPQWNLQAVRQLIQLSLDYIAVIKRDLSGKRYLSSIDKLASLEDSGFLLETLWLRTLRDMKKNSFN